MQPPPIVRTASCTCGQLTAVASGEPVRISICHCLACQRRTGSVFGAQARFPRENVTIEGLSTAYVRVGDSGGSCTFHFCAVCGATVHYNLTGREELVAIPIGAFAEPGFPQPNFSVYEKRKHAWVGLPEDIEHMV
ncbi:MAG TPA: GFA family protein [Usitatibacter sp.]|nr:GFA family protein [Usitatibacter sp.]